jgi:hypothetical protein
MTIQFKKFLRQYIHKILKCILVICIGLSIIYLIINALRSTTSNFENNMSKHLDHLKIYQYDNKIRLGSANDGGYIIAMFPEEENKYDCYISAGVSNEESFSRDFINKFNMKKDHCYAFDGTIQDYPYNYTKEIIYIKKNIGGHNDDKHTNLDFLFNKYNNIFVKMDIEG